MQSIASNSDGWIVLASKTVGLECTRFLLSLYADRVALILTGNQADHEIHELAGRHRIPCFTASNELLTSDQVSGCRYHWMINLWSPFILKPEFLALADHRVNVHPGLVPEGRGNDVAAWTLRKGLQAGVSLLEMDGGVDTGDVYAVRTVAVPRGSTGRAAHDRLQRACIDLFIETWPRLLDGSVTPHPQVGPGTTFRRKMTEKDRKRSGQETMQLSEIVNWALAHDFSPGTTAEIELDDGSVFSIQATPARER